MEKKIHISQPILPSSEIDIEISYSLKMQHLIYTTGTVTTTGIKNKKTVSLEMCQNCSQTHDVNNCQ